MTGVLGGLTVGGSIIAGSCYWYGKHVARFDLQVERVPLPIVGLSRQLAGIRIVQLSDFHMSPPASRPLLQHAVTIANQLEPDIIVLTGDYVSKHGGYIFELTPMLAQLQAKLGVYAILGNHDWAGGQLTVQWAIENAGIPVWRNQGKMIQHNGGAFFLGGLDSVRFGKPNADEMLCGVSDDVPAIVLLHEPDIAHHVASYPQVKALLCGHTHGGQVKLPLLGTPKPFLPILGRKFVAGMYKIDDMWLYVNRGIGTSYNLSARFDCPPEITEFTLQAM